MARKTSLLSLMQGGGQHSNLRDQIREKVEQIGDAATMRALAVSEPSQAPQVSTVHDTVQVGRALVEMAQGATGLAQKNAELAQNQAKLDRERADGLEKNAGERAKAARDEERHQGNSALEVVRQMHTVTLDYQSKLAEAQRQADQAAHDAQLARLEDRLERMEDKYGDLLSRERSRADQAEARATDLQGQLKNKKSIHEEIGEALVSGTLNDQHPIVKLGQQFGGGQSPLVGPDGLPLDPDQRYKYVMVDDLVEERREKRQTSRRLGDLAERLYDDAREYFGLSDGGGQAGHGGSRPSAEEYGALMAGGESDA